MTERIVICTGGYDPLHSGHLAYFKAAKKLGDKLIVGLNSDEWLTRKKGRPFMPLSERHALVSSLAIVDDVIIYNDDDNSSCDAIRKVRENNPSAHIIFANGGDRTALNIPEMGIVDNNLEFAFGVGGEDKRNSSSWILSDWKAPKTERAWGYYRVLHEHGEHTKLKELTVDPGKFLSMQRHSKRSELWFVAEGTATVYSLCERSTDVELLGTYTEHSYLQIPLNQWHQLVNETDAPLKIIEIQYGKSCIEEDIERSNLISAANKENL